jgi:amino acid adenylation domain-containing protein
MDREQGTEQSEYSYEGTELAIIGLAGRFPGAKDLDKFWENLKAGVESISFFDDQEVIAAGVSPELVKDPHYVKAGGILDDVELFDASFFGYYPREAAILDPQQRIFLETAWQALENAGYNPETYPGWIGVFAGMGMNTYLLFNLIQNRELMENVHGYQLTISNDKDFLTTRVSYKLNLRGPSVNVQSACSTSLVAVHLAAQSLLNYQCDIALAGGVSIRLPQKQGYMYQEGGIASPDGHCRAFDVNAAGTVGGNGVGIAVIKRLEDALDEGDNILAIIKGSAINNDGSLKVGYTAPSVDGQSEVIATAQTLANVDPETISYIEAHGTGTTLGDPIEITALTKVFRAKTDKRDYCAIGSVKTNVGHLDAAAGITSLIKTVLALQNKQIPPSVNFDAPNPKIDFSNSPFFVNTQLRYWESDVAPRRAGVSAFGIGGTNAHVVLEEAPVLEPTDSGKPLKLITLSARSEEALETVTDNLTQYLRDNPGVNIADVAYTLHVGRKAFNYRRFLVCKDWEDAIEILEAQDTRKMQTNMLDRSTAGGSPPLVFMFTGQGAQYVNMGRELYEGEPIFHDIVDQCAEILFPIMGKDIRDFIYPDFDDDENNDGALDSAGNELKQTSITQPALFVLEYALANLLIDWGIEPQAMIGHSIGEYVAACLAGVFSLEDALLLVAERGRLMQSMPGGSMVSLPLSEKEVVSLLTEIVDITPNITIATINAPSLCVVSGPHDEIDTFIHYLEEKEIDYTRLHTSHAFHSSMMDPILDEFRNVVSKMDLAEPEIPFISNVSGTWITSEEAVDPGYWASQIRSAVRFSDGLQELLRDSAWIFIEVGPGRTLTTFVRSAVSSSSDHARRIVASTIRHPRRKVSDFSFLLNNLGKLWLEGVVVDWDRFYAHEIRRRIPLPTYPFERQRYWIEGDQLSGQFISSLRKATLSTMQKNPEISQWFYKPSWKRVDLPTPSLRGGETYHWLIFVGDNVESELVESIIYSLSDVGNSITVAAIGESSKKLAESSYSLDALTKNEFTQLFATLNLEGDFPDHIYYLWNVNGSTKSPTFEDGKRPAFSGLLYLVQALAEVGITHPVQLGVVTQNVQSVLGTEEINVEQSILLGLSKVISQEYQNIICRSIDIAPDFIANKNDILTKNLLNELIANAPERIVAYRGQHRWCQVFDPMRVVEAPRGDDKLPAMLKQGGVYLITGGLGRIGLILANYLAMKANARLILVDRFEMPSGNTPGQWRQWLEKNGDDDPISEKTRQLLTITETGGKVFLARADVADLDEMKKVIETAEAQFGELSGVFHVAGIVGDAAIKPIQEIDDEAVQKQFQAKINGTHVLAELLSDKPLDFVFLQSSLSAILGGLGLGIYSAANRYLDSFAELQNQRGATRWMSVDWDGWLFDEEKGAGATIAELAMTPDEGVQAFDLVLSLIDETQVIISTADLDARLDRWIKIYPEQDDQSLNVGGEGKDKAKSTSRFPRPKLQTPYVPPRDELEASITQTWESVLGIDQIGVDDDFFELGGHSLLATQLVSRLRDTYHVQLPLRKLFETPTIAGLAKLIKEAEDAFNQQETVGKEATLVDARSEQLLIQPVPREQPLELSFGQQRLWFLDQMEPESPLYNNFTALRLTGVLNFEGLEYSLRRIVERHEILRTVFQEEDGNPVQVILDQMPVSIKVMDISDVPENDRDQEIESLALEDARLPFDLGKGPLLRLTLVRIADEEHVIFLTMHHIISDGWSIKVLIEEVGAYYNAYVTMGANEAEAFRLPELPIQYADFAHWQRELLQGEFLEEQIEYWEKQLADYGDGNGSVELFPDHQRPPYQTANGASVWFELPEGLANSLVALSQQVGTTLFMTLMAALQVLLYRYTGQEDISVGTPIANRTRVETENLIGFILNTLVIRTDLSGNPQFEEFLQMVKETALEAYAHQDVPFEMLVERLQPTRDMSRAPFFQVIFDLQEDPLPALKLPGLEFSPLHIDNGTAKFDLALSMEMRNVGSDQQLYGYFNYNTDLFERDTIERLIDHWITLLRSIASYPNLPLSKLQLLPEDEVTKVLVDWNDRLVPGKEVSLIHKQFEEIVQQYPEAHALSLIIDSTNVIDDMTYIELDQRANQLANFLGRIGVGSEKLVGVSLERSVDMIVAILGILKAGGAFLPLDPAYPIDRLEYMIDDAGIDVLVTNENLLSKLPNRRSSGLPIERICLDRDEAIIGDESTSVPQVPVMGEDLAYVIYTSGSTGQPKGVMVEHKEFAKHIKVMREHFATIPNDRVLQFASLNFDAALEQIFTTLTAGASLFLRGEDIWSGAEFDRIVRDLELSVVNVPPAYWHQWLQYAAYSEDTDEDNKNANEFVLRLVIIGGDVMQLESLYLWYQSPMGRVRLLNAYGPTETTITAATYEVEPSLSSESDRRYERIPIGKPMTNRTAYILDKYGNPVPIGVPGELYFGGMGIARGYLNKADITAERFVPDTFLGLLPNQIKKQTNVARLYRTGDRARYLPDGNIEFLGRLDDQVKVRGFRIELGEIESVLNMNPGVSEAVVALLESEVQSSGNETVQKDKRLVAYVVPMQGSELTVNELHQYLAEKLPVYMVPSAIVFIEKMPLTPSGKLDRRALPQPEQLRSSIIGEYVAPRDPIEEELAKLWSQVLGIEWKGERSPIGIYDNFFELGGHSLLATQIISRLREKYQVELPVRKVFEAPTIAGLAQLIAESLVESEDVQELDELLAELEELSDEEIATLLADEDTDSEEDKL